MINIQKAAVIGCGFVGASIAYTLMQKGIFFRTGSDRCSHGKAEGEAMDISHGLPFAHAMDIYAGTYADIEDASILIITAGANQKEGGDKTGSGTEKCRYHAFNYRKYQKTAFDGLLLIVSNPVDILTEVALRESGYPEERVIGSGTVLDTARLKYLISEELEIDSRNVHAFIVGEHGDSELAVWSCANIYGIPVEKFAELRRQKGFSEEMKEIYCSVRDSAYEIIKRKGATYYGIGMAAAKIAEALVRDSHTVAPVSVHLNGEYGLRDLCLSIPTVLGKNGAEQILEINFNEAEKEKLWHSAEELKKY